MLVLLVAALLPPLILLVIIYQEDKVDKEPPAMIGKLLALGAVSTIAAIPIELIGDRVLSYVGGGWDPWLLYLFEFFLVVGWTEEGVKHFALKVGSWHSPEFNYRFDAILYGATVALGFAAAENLSYVFHTGLSTAALRAVTAIPGHCIFGIYMGYYYGMAKYWSIRGQRSRERYNQFMSLLVPILLHGFYDYCAASNNGYLTIAFFVYIIILDIIAIKKVRRQAREDTMLGFPMGPFNSYGTDPLRAAVPKQEAHPTGKTFDELESAAETASRQRQAGQPRPAAPVPSGQSFDDLDGPQQRTPAYRQSRPDRPEPPSPSGGSFDDLDEF